MRDLWCVGWVLASALVGCAPPPEDALVTTTDGGTWEVALAALPAGAGDVVLELHVSPSDGAVDAANVSMPSMGHASDAAVTELDKGSYALEVALAMAGWWVLTGSVVGDAGTEDFELGFDVP